MHALCVLDTALQDPFVRFQHTFDPWWNQFWCFVVPALYALYKYNDFWTGFFVLGTWDAAFVNQEGQHPIIS